VDDLHLFEDSGAVVGNENFSFGVLDLKECYLNCANINLPSCPFHGVPDWCVQRQRQLSRVRRKRLNLPLAAIILVALMSLVFSDLS
jgi:hypothetical protein